MLFRIIFKESKQVFKDNLTKSMLKEYLKTIKDNIDNFEILYSEEKFPKTQIWKPYNK